ncbi:MAG: Nodulation protein N [Alphaproteobacteria bacterium]|nr:Nodulation protein N [Alphaproteobacteria bacterium]
MASVPASEVKSYIGKELGVSDWVLIDQDKINKFADVSGDHQFIHVDPEAAAKTPFGGTIAHGFLTLSLLSQLAAGVVVRIEGVRMGINYGFDKVRFLNPVKTGKRVRGRFTLISADERLPGQWAFKFGVKVEIEGEDKPALVAEWLTMQVL